MSKQTNINKNLNLSTLLYSTLRHSDNQYNVYLKKWISFCSTQDHQPLERNDLLCLEFLRRLLKFNYSYSAINSARSALSCIFDNPPFGELPLVTRFMKSVYNIKPHQPRYHKTWDVSTVLKYLENALQPNSCRDSNCLTNSLLYWLSLLGKESRHYML